MPRRAMLIVLALTSLITVAGTIVHGRYSNRWGSSMLRRRAAAALLQELPSDFGSWQLVQELPVDEEFLRPILQYEAFLNREYIDQATGRHVAVTVIVGPPGPTSTHRPEMCFSSRGYAQTAGTKNFTIEGTHGMRHEFALAQFHSPNEGAPDLVATYGWRQEDRWWVPPIPRLTFGGGDYLFKVQLTTQVGVGEVGSEPSSRDFLRSFVELLDKAVFANLGKPEEANGG